MTDDAVDPAVLRSLTSRLGDQGPAMLDKLVDTWEAETDRRLAELQEAVGGADAEGVRRVVHSIRGGSASMGATRLADVCGDVETRIRRGEPVDLAAAQVQVIAAVEQARGLLAQLRVGSAG